MNDHRSRQNELPQLRGCLGDLVRLLVLWIFDIIGAVAGLIVGGWICFQDIKVEKPLDWPTFVFIWVVMMISCLVGLLTTDAFFRRLLFPNRN
jgi:hypothetical protein